MPPILLLALLGQPSLADYQIEGDPYKLVEIRVDVQPPAGFDLFSQEWLVLDVAADFRQYESGAVFVFTAPPGVYQARWRGQYIDWESKAGSSEWRVYTIHIRGPPVEPDPENPTDPPAPGQRLVVVVYESSEMAIPLSVHQARQMLEAAGHQVRVVDQDQVTGGGQIPAELAPSLIAARDHASYPALVVSSLDDRRVLYVVDLPATAEEIVGAVK